MADYIFGIGEELQFNTQDTDLTHQWDFGDGATSTLPVPSHIYTTQGIYTITHSSADFCDTCTSVSHTVEITQASITVKSVLLDKYIANVGDIVTVTVIARNLSSVYGTSTISINFGADVLGPYAVSISPGEETSFNVLHQVVRSGTIDICADNVCTVLFVRSMISVISFTVNPAISTGQTINATVEVKNNGIFTEEKIIQTTLTNSVTMVLDERLVTLASLEVQTYTIPIDVRTLPNGVYTACADGICKAISIAIPAGVGNLNIVTDPQGAEVFIDNIDKGVHTTTTITDVPTGDRSFKLTLANYNDTTGVVTITTNTTTYIYMSLSPLETTTGSIAISSVPTGADIYVDNIQQFDQLSQPLTTPSTISGLSPTSHNVTLKLSGYIDYSVDIDVEVGITKYINAILLQAPITTGNVNFTTIPDGVEIWLAPVDQPLINRGITPRTVPDLPIGNYDFELRLTGYNNLVGTISVVGGLTNYVYAAMVPLSPLTGSISISSIPQDAEIWLAPEGETLVDKGITTPNTIIDLTPGNYTVRLRKQGYTDAEATVSVSAGQTTYVGLMLAIARVMEAGMPWWFALSLSIGTIYGIVMPGKKGERKMLSPFVEE